MEIPAMAFVNFHLCRLALPPVRGLQEERLRKSAVGLVAPA
jgi:hypothetical protein